jgi:Ca-activated chloride channel family protein
MSRRLPVLLLSALLAAAAACSTQAPVERKDDAAAARERDEMSAQNAPRRAEPLPKSEALSMADGVAPPPAPVAAPFATGDMRTRMLATTPQPMPGGEDRENYGHFDSNPVQRAAESPVSTFSIDVDTGSYANVRRFLREGRLPPQDAVRVEEMINYFDYAYAPPRDRSVPFGIETEMARTPWNDRTHLLRIGIQGWKPQGPRVPSNLVFLVDVSGSMNEANKLPLVKSSLKMLAHELGPKDRVSLVVYAGNTGLVLPPTRGDDEAAIDSALERLEAGGSTNGGDGIRLAYAMAQQAFDPRGNNRVLLATDGDFNVGTTSFEALLDLVREKRKTGIALTTLGFGEGNYNDRLMEQLADAGNGNYAYIDSIEEARKTLVDQRDATLTTIARDVKIQVEFNPAVVSEYRLIGYENRALKREDFANDKIDAGDIGAGHTVTALYEVALVGEGGDHVDPLHYGDRREARANSGELAFLRLRYKRPGEGMQAASQLIEQPIARSDASQPSRSLRLAAAVAAFGQMLRGGAWTADFQYTDVARLAHEARGEDAHGYAAAFEQLVMQAAKLSQVQASVHMED